jgi:GNAT superfamily N-acetyltransferase
MVGYVTQLREATPSEATTWLDNWQTRLESWYRRVDGTSGWTSEQVAGRVGGYQSAAPATTFAITAAPDGSDEVVGILAVSSVAADVGPSVGAVSDLWIEPQYRRRGYAAEALQQAADWAREQGVASVWAVTDPSEPAHASLFAKYPIRAHHMIKRLSPESLADGLRWRPMNDDEFADWRARGVEGYAAQVAESGSMTLDEAAARSSAEFDRLLPDGIHTTNQTFLCLCAGEEVVATNWIGHHRSAGTSWVWDVEVSEEHRGKGYGRAAMLAGEQATLDAGDSHLALNVFGQNAVAIGLYTSMGYLTAEQARSADL